MGRSRRLARVSSKLAIKRAGNNALAINRLSAIASWGDLELVICGPRDLRFDLMHFEVNSKKGPSISSPHPQGPAVAFADGAVFRLSEKIPPEVVRAMLTIAGGEKIDREELRRKGWLR